jgi:hypothetical protein
MQLALTVASRTRNYKLVIEAFERVTADLPFEMPGVDSDNDIALMNKSVFNYRWDVPGR